MPGDGADHKQQTLAAQAVGAESGGESVRRQWAEQTIATADGWLAPLDGPILISGAGSYDFNDQWHLVNTGQSGGTAGVDLNVSGVWSDYTGAGVTVGIVDDGIQYTHADLNGNYDTSIDWDAAGNDGTPLPSSSADNHGTAVAGIIGAENDGTGTVGVAYGATLAAFRTDFGSIAQIANLTARQADVDVSNNSWGATPFYDNIHDPAWQSVFGALSDAAIQGRGGLGTSVVFAAGNDRAYGANVNFNNLQNSPFTIAVAAHDHNGTVTGYSTPGAALLVSAPSIDANGNGGIVTTDRTGSAGYENGSYTDTFGGTSAAAPMVSGVVALMLEANPTLGYRDVQEILAYSATRTDPGNATWQYNGADNWNGGGLHTSTDYGFGAVDALAAVRLAETWQFSSTFGNLDDILVSSIVNQTLPDQSTTLLTLGVTQNVEIDHVMLTVEGSHSFWAGLDFTLISPEGTQSEIAPLSDIAWYYDPNYDADGDYFIWTFSSTQFWGEDSLGTWTLRIEDQYAQDSGTLNNWNLLFYGDAGDDDVYVYTDEYGAFTGAEDVARRTLSDTAGNDTINAAAVTTGSVIDLNAGATSTIDGDSVFIQAGTVIENAFGGDGNDTITGNGVDNYLFGGRGDDALIGGDGNDHLEGGAGNDSLQGGVGAGDVAVYDKGGSADFTYTSLGSGQYQISDNVNGLGTDVLTDIEFIDFTDGDGLILLATLFPTLITGTTGDDTLEGTANADQVLGLAGNDALSGLDNEDTLDGGDGNDSLTGGSGNDTLIGGIGDDTAIYAGGIGDFTIVALGGGQFRITDNVNGQGTDTLTGIEFVTFQGDATTLAMSALPLTVIGTTGDDSLTGTANNDTLIGHAGDDTLEGAAGADALDGGVGNDTASYVNAAAGVVADLTTPGNNAGEAAGDNYSSIENLTGSAHGDTLTGDGGNNSLDGNAGNDSLTGGGGNDTLIGGIGDDTAIYAGGIGDFTIVALGGGQYHITDNVNGQGTDTLTGIEFVTFQGDATTLAMSALPLTVIGTTGDDSLTGTANNDTLIGHAGDDTLEGAAGADALDGGVGNDTATYVNAASGVVADLATPANNAGEAGGDSYTDIENLTGSAHNDTLTGDSGANVLSGGAGNDTLTGGSGNDTLIGGDNIDIAIYAGGVADFTIVDISGGQHRIIDNVNGQGTDTLTGIEFVTFQGDATTLAVSDLPLTFFGTAGNDTLSGSPGNDTLFGQAGNDTLDGGAGADALVGGAGNDTATYVNAAADVVADLTTPTNNTGEASGDTYSGIENLTGSAHDDTLAGDTGDNILEGGGGADILVGGGGNDTASYAGASAAVTVDLATPANNSGDAAGDSYTGIDNVLGSGFGDTLRGDAADNTLDGSGGNDILVGGGGNDSLIGGSGSDAALYAGRQVDYTLVDLGSGVHTLTDNVNGNGTDTLSGVETIHFLGDATSIELIVPSLTLIGTDNDDVLIGDVGNDYIFGGRGNDTIDAGDGNDVISGGLGNDVIDGGDGFDIVEYQTYGPRDFTVTDIGNGQYSFVFAPSGTPLVSDIISNVEGFFFYTGGVLSGGSGGYFTLQDLIKWHHPNTSTTIDGNSGLNTLTGGAGNDRLNGYAGNDTLDGQGGDDLLLGSSGNDILIGGSGNDQLDGNLGDDTSFGGDGDDWITVREGDDIVDGGDGYDIAYIDSLPGKIHIEDLGGGQYRLTDIDPTYSVQIGTNLLTGIEALAFGGTRPYVRLEDYIPYQGSTGNDVINGSAGNDTLTGSDGDDILLGSDGHDFLLGGDGNDILEGGAGYDSLYGYSPDSVSPAYDIARYQGSQYDYTVIRRGTILYTVIDDTGEAGKDSLFNIDAIEFVEDGETVAIEDLARASFGTGADDTLTGGSGRDRLIGEIGNDTLWGWENDDILDGGAGNDILIGGEGNDTAIYDGNYDDFTITDLGGGQYRVVDNVNGQGTDTLSEIEGIYFRGGDGWRDITAPHVGPAPRDQTGTPVDDTLIGDQRPNTLEGLSGNDTLRGLGGNDTLLGGDGNDILDGGDGADILDGGDGIDTVSYANSSQNFFGPIFIDLANPGNNSFEAAGDVYISIENVIGSPNDDHIRGDDSDNVIDAGNFNDFVFGYGGNDTLMGGLGLDAVFFSGNIADYRLIVVTPNTIDFSDADGVYYIIDTVGSGGTDYVSGFESFHFADGTVWVSDLESTLAPGPIEGTAGDDILSGTTGGDTLNGLGGNDTISAGAGNDFLNGGEGDDALHGGAGLDQIQFSGNSSDYLLTVAIPHTNGSGEANGEFYITDTVGSDGSDYVTGTELFEFADRTISITELETYLTLAAVDGTSGEDTLTGTTWADTLNGIAGNDTIDGLAGDDALNGGDGDDTLTGGIGNDALNGGADTDTAVYLGTSGDYALTDLGGGVHQIVDNANGEGTDTLTGIELITFSAEGATYAISDLARTVQGTSGDDVLAGSGADDTLNGGDGNDRLDGGAGNDALNGGVGTDTAVYTTIASSGSVFTDYAITQVGDGVYRVTDLVGLQGSDTLTGIEQIEIAGNLQTVAYWATIRGTAGHDALLGSAYDDTIQGNAGNDVISGGAGDDTLDGGGGIDTAAYTGARGDFTITTQADGSLHIVDNVNGQGTDTLTGVEFIQFSSGGEGPLAVSSLPYSLTGGSGDETLTGQDGDDTLEGGAGADTLVGGAGRDAASYANAAAGIVASLSDPSANSGDAAGDSYSDIEDLVGSGHDDRLTGDSGDNRLDGGAGRDVLDGGTGNDSIDGGAGFDTLMLNGTMWDFAFSRVGNGLFEVTDTGSNAGGAQGTKTLTGVEEIRFSDGTPALRLAQIIAAQRGDAGADEIATGGALDMLYGGDGDDMLDGASGSDALIGEAGNDTLYGRSGDDSLFGGSGDDRLYGGSGHDYMVGGADDDTLIGASGDDTLFGGAGDDDLFGGVGNDIIAGGDGADWLYGNAGDDTFRFAAGDGDDTISGFEAGVAGGDVADVSDFGYVDFAALLADISQVGSDAVLQTAADDTLTFAGIDRSDFDQDDFAL